MLRQYSLLLINVLFFLHGCSKQGRSHKPVIQNTKEISLSSQWYPQHPIELKNDITQKIKLAQAYFPTTVPQDKVRALVVPHAGYLYSGLCAATAYQSLCSISPHDTIIKNKDIKRVILLSPSHHVFLQNIAVAPYTHYQTPFGEIEVDHEALGKLSRKDCFHSYPDAFAHEHGIEMQLAFLHATIADFKLVPLVVGKLTQENVVRICMGMRHIIDEHTLVVVSSDFTHHGPNYNYTIFSEDIIRNLRTIDSFATQALAYQSLNALDATVRSTGTNICGYEPLRILIGLTDMDYLKAPHTEVGLYHTSADVLHALESENIINIKKLIEPAPDSMAKNSVSYLSMIWGAQAEETQKLNGYEKIMALKLARDSVNNVFKGKEQINPRQLLPVATPGLDQNNGVFVSFTTHTGALRGCMGKIETEHTVMQLIHDMALATAFKDERFPPVTQEEFDKCVIKIYVLSKVKPVKSYKDIEIGKHGIVLVAQEEPEAPTLTATFLPDIATDNKWTLEETLKQLAYKAGADPDLYEKYQYHVFTAQEITEA